MNEQPADGREGDTTAPLVLTVEEARVLGCLLEKEVTTPDQYPLSLNAATLACNQKSNRAPVMNLSQEQVELTLDEMRYSSQIVLQVSGATSRVAKYRHNITYRFDLDGAQRAVLCALLLRGPQTLAEIRSHATRLYEFASRDEVATALHVLADWPDTPLAVKLPREHGSRECRYAHTLCGPPVPTATTSAEGPTHDELAPQKTTGERVAALETDLAAARTELAALQEQFLAFKHQFE